MHNKAKLHDTVTQDSLTLLRSNKSAKVNAINFIVYITKKHRQEVLLLHIDTSTPEEPFDTIWDQSGSSITHHMFLPSAYLLTRFDGQYLMNLSFKRKDNGDSFRVKKIIWGFPQLKLYLADFSQDLSQLVSKCQQELTSCLVKNHQAVIGSKISKLNWKIVDDNGSDDICKAGRIR